jgi:hypothetical protein
MLPVSLTAGHNLGLYKKKYLDKKRKLFQAFPFL